MAAPSISAFSNVLHVQTRFFTKQPQFAVPDNPFSVPCTVGVAELSDLINKLLKPDGSENECVSFDFLVNGELLRVSLEEHMLQTDISMEALVEVEYMEKQPPPTQGPSLTHDDWVSAICANSDYILTGCYDNAIRIWSLSGELLVTIPGHSAPVKCVAWIRNDEGGAVKRFVSGGHDETAFLWEWDQTKNSVDCLHVCRGHARSVDAVAISPDMSNFATGSWDRYLKIWSTEATGMDALTEEEEKPRKKKKSEHKVPTKVPVLTLSGHTEAVSSVAWLDDVTALSASWDHTLRLWDVKVAEQTGCITGNKVFLNVSYSALSRLVVAGSADQYVRLYDPRSTGGDGIVRSTFSSHTGWVVCVAWSPTHPHHFISGSYDKILKLWDTRSPRAPLYDIIDHEDRILCADWSLPGHMISGGVDNQLRIYKSTENTAEHMES